MLGVFGYVCSIGSAGGRKVGLTSNPWSFEVAAPQAAFNEVGMSGSAKESRSLNNPSPNPTEISELVWPFGNAKSFPVSRH